MTAAPFSGSYAPEDVTFLLTPVDPPVTELAERERRIQAGLAHYSEMIGREEPPSERYVAVFHEAMRRNVDRLALGLARLARLLADSRQGPLTLVSMARAGTPVGVLLRRILTRYFQRSAVHYSVSIIRDRGLDVVALRHILQRHPAGSVAFLDGWTAKGVIARELAGAVAAFAATEEAAGRKAGDAVPDPSLYVLSDLRGAENVLSPEAEDYLIPSCLLNAVVSGLISRSILNRDYLPPDAFHGCVYYGHLAGHDLSRWFVEETMAAVERLNGASPLAGMSARAVSGVEKALQRKATERFLHLMRDRYDITHENFIKPGLGEATRVLLRRVPDRLLVRSESDPDVAPLLVLAQEKHTPVQTEPDMPFKAVALIRRIDHV